MKKWLIVAVLVAFLAIVAATVGGTAVAQATTSEQDCVTIIDQEAYDEVIPAVTHQVKVIDVEAVAGFWANFSPNDTQATFVGPATYPVDARGTWHVHTNGGPGQDKSGVFAQGNPAKGGNWFYRQQEVEEVSHMETVIDVPEQTIHHDAVTHEECNPPGEDLCPNIEGDQDASYIDDNGLVIDQEGNCVVPTPDPPVEPPVDPPASGGHKKPPVVVPNVPGDPGVVIPDTL